MKAPIVIVGPGKLGCSLARLLVEAGEPVAAVAGRTPERAGQGAAFAGPGVRAATVEEAPALGERLLLTVSDDVIPAVARRLADAGAAGGIALHCAGALGPEALNPLAASGFSTGVLHPLQTIASAESGLSALRGIWWGATAEGRAAGWARRIAGVLGGRVLDVPVGARPLYHAAGVMACNFLVVLLESAGAMLEEIGVPQGEARRALDPMIRQTLNNVMTLGADEALTGPILRGDAETVERHLAALRRLDRGFPEIYAALGRRALAIARRRGLDAARAEQLERALRDNGSRNG